MFEIGLLLLIFLLAIFLIGHFFNRKNLNKFLLKEDLISQCFLILSIFFFSNSLINFKADLGNLYTWREVLFLSSIIGLIVSYYFKAILVLIPTLIGIINWWIFQGSDWAFLLKIKTSSVLLGTFLIMTTLYVIGNIYEKKIKYKRFAKVYLILGIIAINSALLFLSSEEGLRSFEYMTIGLSFLSSWKITIPLLILAVFLMVLILYSVITKTLSLLEVVFILILILFFGILVFLPQQKIFINGNGPLSDDGLIWAIIFNLIIFFEVLGLIFSGYIRKEVWLINLGTIFLFLLIILKYFDWFFTFLDKSIFFIGAGTLLFGVGWLMERGRRIAVANIKI
ncbi:MAG: hypothetical protein NTZ20_03400 [Candidatus Levybacteria bacterium]|nr:hypothetical protein [Candidatus Levybacteria bacterium]